MLVFEREKTPLRKAALIARITMFVIISTILSGTNFCFSSLVYISFSSLPQ
jgi:hypothetical protein